MRWPNTKQEECKIQHESEDTVPSKTPLAANARGVVTLDEDLKPATTRLPRPYLTPWRQFAVQLQPISGHSIGDTVCHSVEENRVFKAFVCAEPKVDMSFESLKSQLVWIAKGLGEKNTYNEIIVVPALAIDEAVMLLPKRCIRGDVGGHAPAELYL